jgi:hypothetical protein
MPDGDQVERLAHALRQPHRHGRHQVGRLQDVAHRHEMRHRQDDPPRDALAPQDLVDLAVAGAPGETTTRCSAALNSASETFSLSRAWPLRSMQT